jgi:hypothetical protein
LFYRKSPFIIKQYDQLDGCVKTNHITSRSTCPACMFCLLHCGLDESKKGKKEIFLNGHNDEIHDIVVEVKYNSLNDLFSLSCEVERKNKYERHKLAKIKMDACLAEIEHIDTNILEVMFATNFIQDVKTRMRETTCLTKMIIS